MDTVFKAVAAATDQQQDRYRISANRFMIRHAVTLGISASCVEYWSSSWPDWAGSRAYALCDLRDSEADPAEKPILPLWRACARRALQCKDRRVDRIAYGSVGYTVVTA